MCVDMLTGVHEVTERSGHVPINTHLIENIEHENKSFEWYYYPHGRKTTESESTQDKKKDEFTDTTKLNVDGRKGPVSKKEIKRMFNLGKVDMKTEFWAAGMAKPKPLYAIRELRWLVSKRSGSIDAYGLARLALKILHKLVSLHSALEVTHEVLQPLPRAHREICSPQCLPHICQAVLCGDPQVVSQSAALVHAVVQYNRDVMPKLYLTGIYFFCLAYCGSNLMEISQLFKSTHLCQNFRQGIYTGFGSEWLLGARKIQSQLGCRCSSAVFWAMCCLRVCSMFSRLPVSKPLQKPLSTMSTRLKWCGRIACVENAWCHKCCITWGLFLTD